MAGQKETHTRVLAFYPRVTGVSGYRERPPGWALQGSHHLLFTFISALYKY